MNKLNLTAEQKQAAAILEVYFGDIAVLCDWINQLNIKIQHNFFGYDFKDLPRALENVDLPETTKEHLLDIIKDYNTYQLNIELSTYISDQLKDFVDNIVSNVYK